MKLLLTCVAICILVSMFAFFQSCHQTADKNELSSTEDYLNFPSELSPTTPYDVDSTLEKRLLEQNKIDEAQRLFDILSWQMFISLNWPRNSKGEPEKSITDNGERSWEKWKESFEIFRPNGLPPTPWGSPEITPSGFSSVPPGVKILYRASKMAAFLDRKTHPDDVANEIDQAFTAPIWDQHGNMARYEIRLNKIITDYFVSNELYNLDGQIGFSKAGKQVSFPAGSRDKEGVLEVKVAWKVIDTTKDIAERYYTQDAYVFNKDSTFTKAKVGMIGMHIATRSATSPQWIWATFEHVDNLETNPLKKIRGKTLHPSFYDPACSTCPVNKIPDTTVSVIKNQIQRVLPIPMATQELNKRVQKLLADKESFWQYYQLIGTQWPTDPAAKPYIASTTDSTIYTLPQAITNKSGGNPVPTYLTNMIMETYFQGGTLNIDFNSYLGNEPAWYQIQGFPQDSDKVNTHRLVFGTESCVSCHFSSSIATRDTIVKGIKQAVFGNPGNGNFEWLMQLKAQFKNRNISYQRH